MIVQSIDHVIVAVADLEASTAVYQSLLGRQPSWRGSHPQHGTQNTLFRLDTTYLELLAAGPQVDAVAGNLSGNALGERAERLSGLAFAVPDIDAAVRALHERNLRVSDPIEGEGIDDRGATRRTWRTAWVDPDSSRGLRLMLVQHTTPGHLLPVAPTLDDETSVCRSVDHVVVFTQDLSAALRLWNAGFGIAERWRRDFPERGTRNVGLKLSGITIEFVTRLDTTEPSTTDRLWGVAYAVADCERAVARVRGAGIPIDAPRPGLAPATRVATLRWQRTPSLLIAHQRNRNTDS